MADETRVARTTGLTDRFVVGDLEITPAGIELTYEQWKTVRAAAFASRVRVSLDEDFPAETVTADVEKKPAGGRTGGKTAADNSGAESKEG